MPKPPALPLDRMPPFLCRAYAHVSLGGGHTRPKRVGEIARAAALSTRSVKRLSRRTTWGGVRVAVAFRFAKACGVDLMTPGRVIRDLRHARARSHWQQNPGFYSDLFAEVSRRLTPGSL